MEKINTKRTLLFGTFAMLLGAVPVYATLFDEVDTVLKQYGYKVDSGHVQKLIQRSEADIKVIHGPETTVPDNLIFQRIKEITLKAQKEDWALDWIALKEGD